ncbi:YihY/virulence factor BrkB family protein [Rhodopila sp.]|jgi:membrane protein|uniref:YihY/virulence factor BrkB family protein n=1 Tax=Rhodopila sp. TaxID=2480087 RepID=UPI002BC80A29|nr:YihY/virulence factor BrkB family protein [Rhodopila sp.]HVZ07758.1 YihY/virulence factor BrkB family protein [Rhodopila sp.]
MGRATRLEELKQALPEHMRPPPPPPLASPRQIPLAGWKDVAVCTFQEVNANNIFLIAGGVTYTLLLALFPALAAFVAIYGLLLDPAQVEKQIKSIAAVLPAQTTDLVAMELHNLVEASGRSLTIGALAALLFAFWTTSRGTSGLISAFNIAYQLPETRSFVRFNLIAIGFTLCGMLGAAIVIALIGVLPAILLFVGLGAVLKWYLLAVQWPILLAVVVGTLAVLYRYAPDRPAVAWRWVVPGALIATLLWLAATYAFSLYVAHFSSYSATYGSLAGAVILLTWLYLSSFVALLGAVINAQVERELAKIV